jgi:hypothetical protein
VVKCPGLECLTTVKSCTSAVPAYICGVDRRNNIFILFLMKLKSTSNVLFPVAAGSVGLRLFVWRTVGCDLDCRVGPKYECIATSRAEPQYSEQESHKFMYECTGSCVCLSVMVRSVKHVMRFGTPRWCN